MNNTINFDGETPYSSFAANMDLQIWFIFSGDSVHHDSFLSSFFREPSLATLMLIYFDEIHFRGKGQCVAYCIWIDNHLHFVKGEKLLLITIFQKFKNLNVCFLPKRNSNVAFQKISKSISGFFYWVILKIDRRLLLTIGEFEPQFLTQQIA